MKTEDANHRSLVHPNHRMEPSSSTSQLPTFNQWNIMARTPMLLFASIIELIYIRIVDTYSAYVVFFFLKNKIYEKKEWEVV